MHSEWQLFAVASGAEGIKLCLAGHQIKFTTLSSLSRLLIQRYNCEVECQSIYAKWLTNSVSVQAFFPD